jgi:hypothetical protein
MDLITSSEFDPDKKIMRCAPRDKNIIEIPVGADIPVINATNLETNWP